MPIYELLFEYKTQIFICHTFLTRTHTYTYSFFYFLCSALCHTSFVAVALECISKNEEEKKQQQQQQKSDLSLLAVSRCCFSSVCCCCFPFCFLDFSHGLTRPTAIHRASDFNDELFHLYFNSYLLFDNFLRLQLVCFV